MKNRVKVGLESMEKLGERMRLMIIVGTFLLGFMIAENATLRKDNAKAVQIIQMMKAVQIP